MKTCPFCAETDLQDNAKVCKHCGKDIVKDDVAIGIAARKRYSTFSLDVAAFWLLMVYGFYQLTIADSLWKGIGFMGFALIIRAFKLYDHKKKITQEMELENPSINLSHPSNQQEQQRTKHGQEQQDTQWIDERLKQGLHANKLLVAVVLIFLGIVLKIITQ